MEPDYNKIFQFHKCHVCAKQFMHKDGQDMACCSWCRSWYSAQRVYQPSGRHYYVFEVTERGRVGGGFPS